MSKKKAKKALDDIRELFLMHPEEFERKDEYIARRINIIEDFINSLDEKKNESSS